MADEESDGQTMKGCVLSPDAEVDMWIIWQHVALEAGIPVADRVESTIFEKIGLIATMPGIGHWRRRRERELMSFVALSV